MEWHVCEPYEPADYVRQKAPYPAYDAWDLLSDEERGRVLLSRARIRGEEMPAAVQQFLDGVLFE